MKMEHYQIKRGSNLQTKHSCRIYNYLNGPYLSHNFLIHCGGYLLEENGINDSKEWKIFWRIFPAGGRYSKVGDVISCAFWYLLIIYPFVTIGTGMYYGNKVNIINAVILCLMLMYHLVSIFIIIKNTSKLKTMWCISKLNLEKYVGLENAIREVSKETIHNLDLIPFEKRKKITEKLYQLADASAVVMLCTKSFWKSCLIDPVVCVVCLASLNLIAVLVQLETMNTDILISTHT
ncbi:hypothetical protein LOTGIDRAFT_227866 [Lottia gigantea]|uniref:Uncharacterized protein n=1 Tax=Lottia gigantea TaxID=225164 RepID=V4BC31_LOTGI|nr:hypothetical protein LOTGIDRAFT_227866 [Lottia gigantea]ESP05191.1 hypothetical protein LOTGIDRAFT_227866 [Lottia gigantea]